MKRETVLDLILHILLIVFIVYSSVSFVKKIKAENKNCDKYKVEIKKAEQALKEARELQIKYKIMAERIQETWIKHLKEYSETQKKLLKYYENTRIFNRHQNKKIKEDLNGTNN